MEKNFYQIIGVEVDATDEEIRKSYLAKIKQFHPDTYNGNREDAERITAQINEAYSTLKDSQKRQVYDQKNGFDIIKKQKAERAEYDRRRAEYLKQKQEQKNKKRQEKLQRKAEKERQKEQKIKEKTEGFKNESQASENKAKNETVADQTKTEDKVESKKAESNFFENSETTHSDNFFENSEAHADKNTFENVKTSAESENINNNTSDVNNIPNYNSANESITSKQKQQKRPNSERLVLDGIIIALLIIVILLIIFH